MGGGDGNEVPWTSVFDSTANMRALTAIQAEGFRAASKLVDRFIVAAADSLNDHGGTGGARSAQSEDRRADLWGATDAEPLIKSWWTFVSRLSQGIAAPGDESPGAAGPPTLEFGESEAAGRLAVVAVQGSTAAADIWLHNLSTRDFGEIRLRVSELQSDRGSVVSSGATTLEPEIVQMPGRSGRGVEVRIKVGDSVPPGVYRGNLLTEGHANLWLPIALTVCGRPA